MSHVRPHVGLSSPGIIARVERGFAGGGMTSSLAAHLSAHGRSATSGTDDEKNTLTRSRCKSSGLTSAFLRGCYDCGKSSRSIDAVSSAAARVFSASRSAARTLPAAASR